MRSSHVLYTALGAGLLLAACREAPITRTGLGKTFGQFPTNLEVYFGSVTP